MFAFRGEIVQYALLNTLKGYEVEGLLWEKTFSMSPSRIWFLT